MVGTPQSRGESDGVTVSSDYGYHSFAKKKRKRGKGKARRSRARKRNGR